MRLVFSKKPKKGVYNVAIPIVGCICVQVEAESEADAYEKMWSAVDDLSPEERDEALEWEYCEQITEGNVLHASQNEVEINYDHNPEEGD